MVALDEQGRPSPVPAVLAQSADEVRRLREAELRRANRLTERAEIQRARDSAPGE
jgi:acyl-CoA hydrolase